MMMKKVFENHGSNAIIIIVVVAASTYTHITYHRIELGA
jgi:hypothetical protein